LSLGIDEAAGAAIVAEGRVGNRSEIKVETVLRCTHVADVPNDAIHVFGLTDDGKLAIP
jgi:hypothetical protein